MSESKEQKDAFCIELIQSTKSKEVISWLSEQNKTNTLGANLTPEKSLEFIQEIIDIGAVKVTAVDIDTYDGEVENTGKLCIELPNEPNLRQQIFDWTGKIVQSQGYDQEQDIGQKYIFIMLD